jgi:hypothetical protein
LRTVARSRARPRLTRLAALALSTRPRALGAHQVLSAGLNCILCVGELKEQREDGSTDAVVAKQLKAGLATVTEAQLSNVVIAYEPVRRGRLARARTRIRALKERVMATPCTAHARARSHTWHARSSLRVGPPPHRRSGRSGPG